ncbi:hypothetical protein [Gaoshiqia sediminis]|uniref:Lipoprotein n=1 Tax=Gaoshiqia sediminis TaxID=2986998 RepID=A0AA41YEZ6_9BACT|nr:hypothetical protein [Gaoshiqia sediminis]MCW0484827.1 hypothetical protein [Gaoshiqia sediminis]
MKKLAYLMIFALAVVGFNSCDNGDDPIDPGFQVDSENLQGTLAAGDNVTLDASVTYKLTGALIVEEGATLTIPAGTVIEATQTTSANPTVRYIAVAQGGKIYVNGTAGSPVVMTSEVKETESWGGLVVCGKAPTNKSDSGSAGAEVSGLSYGGDVANDNSGSITYLRLEYTGYKYTDEKEFNGLSCFGVGSGTTIDYVVSYKGGDDGIEFFGGTVNASHLVSVDSGDDGIDFADGWSGTGEYWVAINSAKSGIEGSNNGDNGAATPMTTATLNNLTIYGMGEKPFYFKEGAGVQTIDNIVLGGLAASKAQSFFYADASDANAAARIAAGDITITNVSFVGMAEGQSKAVDGLTFVENAGATGAGNGINKPSWMPDALNNVDGTNTVFGDAAVATIKLSGEITTDVELSATNNYILDGALIVANGGSLTIPAGTVLEASEPTEANSVVRYIAVAQGGKIFVNGTATEPVIMTSSVKATESWGGLVVCGKAPTNKSDSGTAGAEVSGLSYGGTVADDNSGSITYLRLEYTGYKYSDTKEFNGLSCFGVGSGTTIDYVVSYKGGDDGMEFFGGTVNASHLLSVESGDDGIDFADGWSGTGNYWFALNSAKSGIEGSNNGDNYGATNPMTDATITNITVYGMGEKPYYFKEGGGKQTIDNIVIGGLNAAKTQAQFYIDSSDTDAAARIAANEIVVTNARFIDMAAGQTKAVSGLSMTESDTATGAGNGKDKPSWLSDALNTIATGVTIF